MAAVNKRLPLLIAIRIIVKQRQRQRRRNQVACRGRRKDKFWVRQFECPKKMSIKTFQLQRLF